MPRKDMTESGKRLASKKHHESVHLKHIKPDVSQGGLTGVRFIAHEAQSSAHTFLPYPFDKGVESRLYGGHEKQLLNTHKDTHRVRMNSENLRKMVASTVGNAYNLANPMQSKVGPKHRDNTVKGSLLGFKSATVPERMGQVPYAGRFF
jgi:hypothetical protein